MAAQRKELEETLAYRILSDLDRADPNARFTVLPMGGGVSSTVLLADNGPWRHVLKQPLGRFRVREEWIVDTDRAQVEFDAGRFLADHLGQAVVMPVLHYDAEHEVLVMEAAESGWSPWKQRLLGGEVRPGLAEAAGRLLADLHGLAEKIEGPDGFRNERLFFQQRIDPYFRASAARRPELAGRLRDLEERFRARDDLVHGDYSPKNLLTNGFNLRLIDHEVVTRGDAAFDVAFLLNHLLLKSVHRPQQMGEFHAAALAAFRAYVDRSPPTGKDVERRTAAFLGGLHLARAVGKSRAEYLTKEERRIVADAAERMLEGPAGDVASCLEAVREASRSLRTETA